MSNNWPVDRAPLSLPSQLCVVLPFVCVLSADIALLLITALSVAARSIFTVAFDFVRNRILVFLSYFPPFI